MSLCGLGVVTIWHDLLPQARDNFYEWHNREHMPERVAIPGFRRGRRYIALDGTPEYFNLYEADNPEVLAGPDYLKRLNSPTPWTRESVLAFRNVARAICRVLYSAGVGQGGTMLTLRFDVPEASAHGLAELLRQQVLPALVEQPGIVGVHLCRSDESGSRIDTAEKKLRNQDTLVPRWVVLIEGISAAAVQRAGAALRRQAENLGHGLQDVTQATYVLEAQCSKPAGA